MVNRLLGSSSLLFKSTASSHSAARARGPLFSGDTTSGEGIFNYTAEEKHAIYEVIRELRGIRGDASRPISNNARILIRAIAEYFITHSPKEPKDSDIALAKELKQEIENDQPIYITSSSRAYAERFITCHMAHWKKHWAREHSIQNGRYPAGLVIPDRVSPEDILRDKLMGWLPI